MCVLSLRPAVRALPSRQMFEHMLKRHNVLFVYVGGESPLKVSTTLHIVFPPVSQAVAAAAERASVLKLMVNCCFRKTLVFRVRCFTQLVPDVVSLTKRNALFVLAGEIQRRGV